MNQAAGKLRIGALISGGGSNLQAIIDACEARRIHGSVVFVGSDTPHAEGLKRAAKHGIPSFVVDYRSIMEQARKHADEKTLPNDFDLNHILQVQTLFKDTADRDRLKAFFSSRAMAEATVIQEMEGFSFDLLVLAGFMRILTPYFIDKINRDPLQPRIINIHPALLPAFPGTDGYGDTFRYGCKVGGCTVHFIDYGEDTGPIIGQKSFDIRPYDTLESVRKKGLQLEWELYPACIQLFAENRLKVIREEHQRQDGTTYQKKTVKILPAAAS
jgi:phosphoribosylglycinamide formyltransferase-1